MASLFRLALGLAQMTAAIAALLFLARDGLTGRAVAWALGATILTAVSQLLYPRAS